jgi:hypothetical protein
MGEKLDEKFGEKLAKSLNTEEMRLLRHKNGRKIKNLY